MSCTSPASGNLTSNFRCLLGRSVVRTLLQVAIVAMWIEGVEGAKIKRRKKNSRDNNPSGSSVNRVATTLKITYTVLFLPILITFFYSLYRDPATPQIARSLWNIAKKKSMGYLGRPDEVDLENKRN
ncbi:hypothetical protein TrCOL_g12225 [Triparma columacea]|uniref:Uncharacterized protein n=1 Tax=Triparma columacea TaxID=722753 RepID=A0A9W7GGH6_9STRA|nr:hypothetical protein TrCOL_g12225 [Triparma columacea]